MNQPPPNDQNHSPLSTLHARPLSVTLLAFGVLIIAGFNLVRCIQAAVQWQFLTRLLDGLPLYQGLSGLVWALASAALAWGLWQGASWAARLVSWVTLAYVIYFWIDRLTLRRGLEPTNLPFILGLTALAITYIFWTLSKDRARRYFGARKA